MCDAAATSLTSTPRRSLVRRGFTLIEILIVVVILGILAAVVLPQFSNASNIARENTLKDELRYLRTQITVYKAQHRDQSPGFQNGVLSGSPEQTFIDQMTQFTDEAGNVSATSSAAYKFGPYLLKMPPNSLTSDPTLKIVTSGAATMTADDSTGWLYNAITGDLIANNTKSDNTGAPYAGY